MSFIVVALQAGCKLEGGCGRDEGQNCIDYHNDESYDDEGEDREFWDATEDAFGNEETGLLELHGFRFGLVYYWL